MTKEIIVPESARERGLARLSTDEYIRNSRSANTRRAYSTDWGHFQTWCRKHRVGALPAAPATIAAYISDMAEQSKPSTIQRHLASISVAHQAKGLESPTQSLLVRTTLNGIRRVKGAAREKKSPIRVSHLLHLGDVLPKNLQGVRDKALFLIGYAGAFRRSELVQLNLEDIRFVPEGVRITVRHSKTDQTGLGHTKDINHATNAENCPVKSLQEWIEEAGIKSGPVFRPVNRHGQLLSNRLTPPSVALIVKRVMQAMQLDPSQFSGHSLRAGFVTDAIKNGVQPQTIRRVTGHRAESTLFDYYREADLFDYNIVAKLGL